MGDIHVHTAPHAFETEGYTLWCRADSALSVGFLGLALAEGFVAYSMVKRSKELPWGECRGGEEWWRRKFMLIVMLVPVTLLRFYNMFVWAEFNCDVSTGQADIVAEDHHKLTGDWLNAITFWYYLAVKSLFLLGVRIYTLLLLLLLLLRLPKQPTQNYSIHLLPAPLHSKLCISERF